DRRMPRPGVGRGRRVEGGRNGASEGCVEVAQLNLTVAVIVALLSRIHSTCGCPAGLSTDQAGAHVRGGEQSCSTASLRAVPVECSGNEAALVTKRGSEDGTCGRYRPWHDELLCQRSRGR